MRTTQDTNCFAVTGDSVSDSGELLQSMKTLLVALQFWPRLVLSEYSESPASFDVYGENISQFATTEEEFRLDLSWPRPAEEKAKRLRATMQRKPLVELAATAVALVVAHRVLDLGDLDVTAYGDRADFRAVRRRCVLEISGTEVAAEFDRRHREKVAQAVSNPFGWDAFVVVCLFSAKGHRLRVSHHEYREESDE